MGILTYLRLAKTEDMSVIMLESHRLKKLRLESLQNDPKSFLSVYEHEVDQPPEFWLDRHRDVAAQHWVALDTDETETQWVAFLVVITQPFLQEATAHIAVTENLAIGQYLVGAVYVDPAWRRRNICTNLIQLAVEWVAEDTHERGLAESYLNLNVREDNRAARKLYSKLGFVDLDREIMTTEVEPDKQHTVINMRMVLSRGQNPKINPKIF